MQFAAAKGAVPYGGSRTMGPMARRLWRIYTAARAPGNKAQRRVATGHSKRTMGASSISGQIHLPYAFDDLDATGVMALPAKKRARAAYPVQSAGWVMTKELGFAHQRWMSAPASCSAVCRSSPAAAAAV
jgi:hypothetical protein